MQKNMMKEMLICIGASAISMLAGIIVGAMKEKLKMNTCCIIDEM